MHSPQSIIHAGNLFTLKKRLGLCQCIFVTAAYKGNKQQKLNTANNKMQSKTANIAPGAATWQAGRNIMSRWLLAQWPHYLKT